LPNEGAWLAALFLPSAFGFEYPASAPAHIHICRDIVPKAPAYLVRDRREKPALSAFRVHII